jgi:hypothetical protein
MHEQQDNEDDDDEKLFAELHRRAGKASDLQRGVGKASAPRRRNKAHKETFVKVPLWWFEQATRATKTPQAFVAVWLLHRSWKAKSTTFPVSNSHLGERGADRRIKRRALANLEKAGLITIERRNGRAPRVTLIVL